MRNRAFHFNLKIPLTPHASAELITPILLAHMQLNRTTIAQAIRIRTINGDSKLTRRATTPPALIKRIASGIRHRITVRVLITTALIILIRFKRIRATNIRITRHIHKKRRCLQGSRSRAATLLRPHINARTHRALIIVIRLLNIMGIVKRCRETGSQRIITRS